MRQRFLYLVVAGIIALLLAAFSLNMLTAHAAPGDWSTYLFDLAHSGVNKGETIINPSSVASLHEHWHFQTGGSISTQPVEVNGTVYWGSWDGNEYATDLNGNKRWATNLGTTTDGSCRPTSAGVASTATVVPIAVGSATSVVYVGGGNANFYALNASNGNILWHTQLGPSPSTFIWSSPTFYQNSIYIGVSSFGDCPLVQGMLVQMDAVTGHILHIFATVPNGCTGGGVWGTPTVDKASGFLFFVTGNNGSCSTTENLVVAIIKLRVADLTFRGAWQVPSSEHGDDSDFGSTPTLFKATIGGTTVYMVGVINKNGVFYAFKRSAITAGPVWRAKVGNGGDCPQCGTASISPAAWDGTHLYVASGNATINGSFCRGSLQELDPATGHALWQRCLNNGPVLAAVSAVPGVAFVTAGTDLIAIATANGGVLKTITDSTSGSLYYGAASISNGVVYVGNMDGLLHAYGT